MQIDKKAAFQQTARRGNNESIRGLLDKQRKGEFYALSKYCV